MKHALLGFALLFSVAYNALAHEVIQTHQAKSRYHNQLVQFDKVPSTVSRVYKIIKIDPKRSAHESEIQLYTRVVQSTLDKDYPTVGNSTGYSFAAFYKTKKDLENTLNKYDVFIEINGNAEHLTTTVANAVEAGLIVLVGEGKGYNTTAAIIAIIDPINHEFSYLMSGNF